MIEAILQFIVNIIGQIVIEVLFKGIAEIFIRIGSVVLSAFSFFKVTPNDHYKSEKFEDRVVMFWMGVFFSIIVLVFVLCSV